MPSKNPTKILLIDDEKEFCLAMREFLSDEGYEVCCATDVGKGIGKFRSFKPDLILLDIRMPKTDGVMALKTIREESDVPVIMLSAVGELKTTEQCLQMGAKGYMTKPINLDDLKMNISQPLHTN